MKSLLVVILMTFSILTHAHVGGHHQENIFTPKYGGTLAEVKNSSSNIVIAELAKNGKKGLFLFFYDKQMKLISAKTIKATVKGKVTSGRGKRATSTDVTFKVLNDRFSLDLPEIRKRPYSLVIEIKQNNKISKVNFMNID